MDTLLLFVSGVVMGLIAAVPVGPVNLICIRRAVCFGPVNGFMSGLGAALGDGVFAAVTGFGLTAVAQWVEGYSSIINFVGGVLLIFFGVRTFFTEAPRRLDDEDRKDRAGGDLTRAVASTFALTVTNPATLLAFTAMFAGITGLSGAQGDFVDPAIVVAGVVAGSTGWWLMLTTIIGIFHTSINEKVMHRINQVSGVAVTVFGIVVLANLVRHF